MIRKYLPYVLVTGLVAAALFVMLGRRGSTLKQDISDFIPAPDARIDKFTITRSDSSVIFRKTGSGWVLEGGRLARPEVVQFFFETLQRLEIVSPVSRTDRNRIQQWMPGHSREVSFYENGRKLASFYIGYNGAGVKGTYIMSRNRSPFRVKLKGYDQVNIEGFFSLQRDTWQAHSLLGYQAATLAAVSVEYTLHPENNFKIAQGPPGVFSLTGNRPIQAGHPNMEKIGDYLNFFGEISYSRIKTPSRFMQPGLPEATLRISPSQGSVTTLDIFPFFAEAGEKTADKNLTITVIREYSDTVVVKHSDLDPLLLTFSDFQKK